MNAKKVLALSLVSAMAASTVAACSGSSTSDSKETTKSDTNQTNAEGGNTDETKDTQAAPSTDEKRTITLGTWWDMYYTSEHHDVDDQPNVTKRETAEMQLENIRNIEEKYNVEFYAENMTWEGIIASINTSIMAGKPDVDIYLTDLQFGVPAVVKGYAIDTAEYDLDGRLEEGDILTGLAVGDRTKTYLFHEQNISSNGVYMLGFNMDMINDLNLENPQDLYDRGEWTWDVFLDYLKKLTIDKDNDGSIDVYGYGGWWTQFVTNMLMANGADIAATDKEHLSDPKTVEVFEFLYDIYNTYKVARPWDSEDWDINNYNYTSGKNAFWITANWIAQDGGDADETKISFEVGVVPFPKGPSLTTDDYFQKSVAGNYYMIPKGTEDPSKVFNVFYDWINWFDYDLEYRDDNEWAQNVTYSPKAEDPERNFNYLLSGGSKEFFDPWGTLQLDGQGVVSGWEIMSGEKTAAQYIEENKQRVQEAIDMLF